tara:strand:+ start:1422 stop:1622 length:201 start_codon:yes stop_codon:yes gene_type:complete
MAGKTAVKPKVKKEPEIDMTYIDDILFRLDRAETNIDIAIASTNDKLEYHELALRVEKVEARLGIG